MRSPSPPHRHPPKQSFYEAISHSLSTFSAEATPLRTLQQPPQLSTSAPIKDRSPTTHLHPSNSPHLPPIKHQSQALPPHTLRDPTCTHANLSQSLPSHASLSKSLPSPLVLARYPSHKPSTGDTTKATVAGSGSEDERAHVAREAGAGEEHGFCAVGAVFFVLMLASTAFGCLRVPVWGSECAGGGQGEKCLRV
eukprot:1158186-Pelagomonas_calceolata.AAC.10